MKLSERVRGAIRGFKEDQAGFYKDGLTGLLNIGFLNDGYLDHIIAEAIRYNRSLSVVIVDIDNFKSINDNFGHDAGDRVLIGLRDIMKEPLRKADWLIRYGGDEFLLILPETKKEGAAKLMQRMNFIDITVSYGIADIKDIADLLEKEFTWKDLLNIVDQRLLNKKALKHAGN